MGSDVPILNGNRYCLMFIIKESLFGMVFLHAYRSLETTTQVLKDVFRYAGCKPKNISSDGAAEYVALDDFMRAENIHHQFSNPDEQEQNSLAEKFCDQIGWGVHAMLLQRDIATEFWGAAVLYGVETRNHLLHLSINNEIPVAKHTVQKPDIW